MLDYKLVTFLEGMIIIQEAVISFIEKLKNASRMYKLIAFGVFSIILIAVSVFSSGVKLTYNLIYNGEVFATVSSKSVYNEAVKLAKAELIGDNTNITTAEIKSVFTINEKTDSAKEVSQLILKKAPSVCSGFEVVVGDKLVGYISDITVFEKAKNDRLSSFNIEGAQCENSFTVNVSATPAYFTVETLTKAEDVQSAISKLDVKTVAVTNETYTVKYETVAKNDSSKNAGYQSVITKGVNGLGQTSAETTYLNGEAVSDPVITKTIMRAPVDEVVVVGTKNVYVTSAPQNASSSGFRWPLSKTGMITSEFGERRGSRRHGGVDLAVPTGTSVFAVKSGTVEEAGYASDYGYYIVINHGNGLKTRYAHNKKNIVSSGQTVYSGQLIALSGNTGRSTGPHLHFEVILNGTRVNPGYYINLNKAR